MRRLMAKRVASGFVTAWRLAGWPTRRSPESVTATCEGVVRAPSAFSMTRAVLPSITDTHELVVPRSIPMTLAICESLPACGGYRKPGVALFDSPLGRGPEVDPRGRQTW